MAEKDDPSELAVMTFELLKRMQEQLGRMADDLHDVKVRLSALEATGAQQAVQIANLNARMDRFDERFARIERRLDLTDA